MLCDTPLGGRPERHWRRTMIDAMFYICDNGCKWRALPADFPPWQTVHAMLARWKRDGVWADIADLLHAAVRRAAGRHPEPSAAVMDSQSVHESAEGVVPAGTSGFDSWKKVNGRKRHLLADTLGLLIAVVAGPASGQDPGRRRRAATQDPPPRAPPPRPGLGGQRLPRRVPGLVTHRARHHDRDRRPPRPRSGAEGKGIPGRAPPARSSNAPTPGSAAAGAAPATTSAFPATTPPWSRSPPSSR
jgi:transposase